MKNKTKNKVKNKMKITITLLIAFLMVITSGCGSKSVSNLNIQTAVADKHSINANFAVSGVLVPIQTANISTKSGGQIKAVNVNVGSRVNVGDVLVTFETKELNAQLQSAQAAYQSVSDQAGQAKINLDTAQSAYLTTKQMLADQQSQAKINLDSAQNNYDRVKALADSGAVSQSQLEDAKSKLDLATTQYNMANIDGNSSAQSQLAAAKSKYDLAVKQYQIASGSSLDQSRAAINSINVQLDNAVIKSPISGVVVSKNFNPGEIVSPNALLLTVADTTSLKLKGTVPQNVLPLIKVGQGINVFVDIYPNKPYAGKVDSIGPMAVSTGEYFPIEISIPNDGSLSSGLSAKTSFDLSVNNGVIVPLSAVVQNNGQPYVFVVNNNIAVKRIVTLGLNNDKEICIMSGLNAGEIVVSSNVNSVFDNMPIK